MHTIAPAMHLVFDTQVPTAEPHATPPPGFPSSIDPSQLLSMPSQISGPVGTHASEGASAAVSPTPVSPGPVSPGPVSPGPVSPGPVSPGPVSPGPVSPGPVSPPAESPTTVSATTVSPTLVSPTLVSA